MVCKNNRKIEGGSCDVIIIEKDLTVLDLFRTKRRAIEANTIIYQPQCSLSLHLIGKLFTCLSTQLHCSQHKYKRVFLRLSF